MLSLLYFYCTFWWCVWDHVCTVLPEANIKRATGGLLLPLEMPSRKQADPQLLFQKITGLLKIWQRNLQETVQET